MRQSRIHLRLLLHVPDQFKHLLLSGYSLAHAFEKFCVAYKPILAIPIGAQKVRQAFVSNGPN